MTERNTEADSGRSIEQKRGATVLDTSGPSDDPDVYLVEYPDGSVRYEPATPKNTALFEGDLYERVQGENTFRVRRGENVVEITLEADVAADDYTLTVEGQPVRLGRDHVSDLIRAFDGGTGAVVGTRLYNLYEEIIEGQARRHVVAKFEDRFPEDRIERTAEGWEIDDTFLVTFEAENRLLDTQPVSPRGSDFDESKQAVYLNIDATGTRTVRAPTGEQVELTETEQEFLTMVEGLLFPEDYFGAELVEEITQHKVEGQVLDDVIEEMTDQAEVTGFTDPKTGIHHGSTNHSFQKHRLSDLGVTDEVSDLLWANDYDHAGVHEMALRRDELVNRPDLDVFEDVPDDDEARWRKIEQTREKAPIPPSVQETLDEMY